MNRRAHDVHEMDAFFLAVIAKLVTKVGIDEGEKDDDIVAQPRFAIHCLMNLEKVADFLEIASLRKNLDVRFCDTELPCRSTRKHMSGGTEGVADDIDGWKRRIVVNAHVIVNRGRHACAPFLESISLRRKQPLRTVQLCRNASIYRTAD